MEKAVIAPRKGAAAQDRAARDVVAEGRATRDLAARDGASHGGAGRRAPGPRSREVQRRVVVASIVALWAAAAVACASTPDDSKDPTLAVGAPPGVPSGADPTTFRTNVNAVFERRCASLDCHGSLGRGMRLYSSNGLRLPNEAGLLPGSGSTSADEINSNYASIVGLEPEKTNDFLAKSPRTPDDAYQLDILAKPLGLEKHKGGPALSKGEPAEQCIVTWLIGTPLDPALCVQGATPP